MVPALVLLVTSAFFLGRMTTPSRSQNEPRSAAPLTTSANPSAPFSQISHESHSDAQRHSKSNLQAQSQVLSPEVHHTHFVCHSQIVSATLAVTANFTSHQKYTKNVHSGKLSTRYSQRRHVVRHEMQV